MEIDLAQVGADLERPAKLTFSGWLPEFHPQAMRQSSDWWFHDNLHPVFTRCWLYLEANDSRQGIYQPVRFADGLAAEIGRLTGWRPSEWIMRW